MVYFHGVMCLINIEQPIMIRLFMELKGLEAKGPFLFRPSGQDQKGLPDSSQPHKTLVVKYYLKNSSY